MYQIAMSFSLAAVLLAAGMAGTKAVSLSSSKAQGNTSIGDGGPATEATLIRPGGLAIDSRGRLYISEWDGNRIRRVDLQTGIITTFAGTGERDFGGDGSPATAAQLNGPLGLEFDGADNLYIADVRNQRIRRVDGRTGIITTIAGNGEKGFGGDGGPATSASMSDPYYLTADTAGNVYVTDTNNDRIRRIDVRTGVITTVAGSGVRGFSGDGGLATRAEFYRPHVVEIDPDGNLVIGDSFNQRIRRVDAKTGIVRTIAGNGELGSSGDGGPATEASFSYFGDIVFDPSGVLLVSGLHSNRVRRIDLRTGIIHALAGAGGEESFGGDGGPALGAKFNRIGGLAVDEIGNLYIADSRNNRVRRVDARTGIVTTIAGIGTN